MAFEIAVGTARTAEPEYKHVKFTGLTGREIEIDDPVVLVMNTMSRRYSILPKFPKIELPRIEFKPPDTEGLGLQIADLITEMASRLISKGQYEKLFEKEAGDATILIPEIDVETIAKVMRDAAESITGALDLEDAIAELLDGLPNYDFAQ